MPSASTRRSTPQPTRKHRIVSVATEFGFRRHGSPPWPYRSRLFLPLRAIPRWPFAAGQQGVDVVRGPLVEAVGGRHDVQRPSLDLVGVDEVEQLAWVASGPDEQL